MTKGERCPFDTAVAIHILQYRAETLKFDLCDSLITDLNVSVENQRTQISIFEKQIFNLQQINTLYDTEFIRKDAQINELLNEYEFISRSLNKEKTWWKKNGKWITFGIGLIGGSVATYYIIR